MFGVVLVAATSLGSVHAHAAEEPDDRVAIQRRKFLMAHELRLSLGSMPLDAFQKGWTASLSYTMHLNEYVAWEVAHATVALLSSTNLRDTLIATFAVPPEDFAAPRFMLTSGLELTPFYGKQAFLNDEITHQGLFMGAYGGVMFGDRESFGDTLGDLRPAAGLGIGYRMFLSKLVSVRFDARGFGALRRAVRTNEQVELEAVLFLSLSGSLNLWRDDA